MVPYLVGSTKQVKLTVYIDKESARAMNSGDEKIEDILVLHLEGGKDFFVSLMLMITVQNIKINKQKQTNQQQKQQQQRNKV